MPPLVAFLSAAHPAEDLRVLHKQGATLAAAGWRVMHICPDAGAPRLLQGVVIQPYPPRLRRWRRLPLLLRLARESGAAVLHAQEPDAWLVALLAARRGSIRVVLDVHEHYPSRLDAVLPRLLRPPARWLLRRLCAAMAARADAVVLAKEGIGDDFAAAPLLLAVRNYALLPVLPPRRHRAGEVVTLLHLGACGRARGWPQLLRAMAAHPASLRLLLVGRFTDGSEAAFWAAATALGLAGRIQSLGWLPWPEAMAAAATADIGLVLFQPGAENHRLALPHKLFDAMALGLPVIAPAAAPQVAAVVQEAGCGELVDTADAAAIAAAIGRLLPAERRARLGAAGRAAALGRFAWGAEGERLVSLYRRLAPLPAVNAGPAAPAVL